MKRALLYLWRHPRRTGFIAFNLVVLAALFGWGYFTNDMSRQGVAGLPNVALGYTGMAIAIAALIGWLGYGELLSLTDWIGALAIGAALVLVRLPSRDLPRAAAEAS